MLLADGELTGFAAGFEIGTALAAGCGFDCVGTWVFASEGFEGFSALFAGPDFEGSS